MRTPLDAFHQALVNHVETRRRTEEGAVRRRRRTGVTYVSPGVLVKLMIPTNLLYTPAFRGIAHLQGRIGTLTGEMTPQSVIVDFPQSSGNWVPAAFLDLVDPPPGSDNIEDIERWLNEN